ncbi:MAG: crossover junction endodeoxyribonuclease RuvC [Patescibacteria group bacterium]
MITIGIDPGSTKIGFGVVEHDKSRARCLTYGTIINPGVNRAHDLKHTAQELSTLIKQYRPTLAVVERLFFTKNQKTAMVVAETRGVIILTLANHAVAIQELTPLQVKQAVAHYGQADKKQMQRMVQMILGLKEVIKPDDAADALALALCAVLHPF